MIKIPPYMTAHQFMLSGSTVEVRGKKAKTKTGQRKHSDPMLMAMPNRPSVHLCGGRGSPLIRLRSTQPIVIIYDDIIALIVRVTMASSAAEEPILMSDKRIVTTNETITAFKGIFQPGLTLFCQ
jgi:hypothetical protein